MSFGVSHDDEHTYTYEWHDGSTEPVLTGVFAAANHIISVTITDENGCTGSASESITILTAPNIAIGGDTITCEGDSVLLTLEGSFDSESTINWSDNTHETTTYGFPGNIYSVNVSQNGCSDTASIFITQDTCTVCEDKLVQIDLPDSRCEFEELSFAVSHDDEHIYTYEWQDGSTDPVLTNVFDAGDHSASVTITDENGCTGAASTTFTVYPQPDISIEGDSISCSGDSVLLTAIGNFEPNTVLWNTGETTISIYGHAGEIYEVTASLNGCEASAFNDISFSGRPELGTIFCSDGIDNDCDGLLDCDDSDCHAFLTCDPTCRSQYVHFEAVAGRISVLDHSHFDIGSVSSTQITLGTRSVTSEFEYTIELNGLSATEAGISLRLNYNGQSIEIFNGQSTIPAEEICTDIPTGTEEGLLYIRAIDGILAVWTSTTVYTLIEVPALSEVQGSGASITLNHDLITEYTGTFSLNEDGCSEPIDDDLPTCKPREICDDGVDNDDDGLVDCEDEECVEKAICDPDVYCEILSLITITQSDIHKIRFSYERDGTLDHTLSRLDELGLSIPETQGIINTIQNVRYDVEESFLDGNYGYHDSIYLRMATMRTDFISWKMNVFTKNPVTDSTDFKRNFTLKKAVNVEQSCQNIINTTPPDVCLIKETLLRCSGVINPLIGLERSILYFESDFPNLIGKMLIYDLSDGIKLIRTYGISGIPNVVNRGFLDLAGYGPFLVVTRDKNKCIRTCIIEPDQCVTGDDDTDGLLLRDTTINVTQGACIRIENIYQKFFECFSLRDLINNIQIILSQCSFIQSEEYGQFGSRLNKLCPTQSGNINVTLTDGYNILGEITVYINLHPPYDINGNGIKNEDDPDVDGDGINNEDDTDDDGDGIPDDRDSTPQGLDSDIDDDGIPNEEDCNIDGDNSPNQLDPDTDNDGIENDIDPDDDNDGILDIDDEMPTGLETECKEDCNTPDIDEDNDGLLGCDDPDCKPIIEDVIVGRSECDVDLGLIIIESSGENLTYQINDGPAQTENEFHNLGFGEYLIKVTNQTTGCYSEHGPVTVYRRCEICDDAAEEDEDGDGYANCDDSDCILQNAQNSDPQFKNDVTKSFIDCPVLTIEEATFIDGMQNVENVPDQVYDFPGYPDCGSPSYSAAANGLAINVDFVNTNVNGGGLTYVPPTHPNYSIFQGLVYGIHHINGKYFRAIISIKSKKGEEFSEFRGYYEFDLNSNKFVEPYNEIPDNTLLSTNGNLIFSTIESNNCEISYYCIENFFFREYTKVPILLEDIRSSISPNTEPFKSTKTDCLEPDSQPRKEILIFVNGYRYNFKNLISSVTPWNENGILTNNDVYKFDRFGYWSGLGGNFVASLQPEGVFFLDGSMSISTSNHNDILTFIGSLESSAEHAFVNRTGLANYTCDNFPLGNYLNTNANDGGFNQRRAEGGKGGDNLVELLEADPDITNGFVIDIVSHSMGFAYALGVYDKLKESDLDIQFDRFYTMAPENACAGEVNIGDFQEVWQYGSNLGIGGSLEDKCYEQDGVAPQCAVQGLELQGSRQYGRAYIPKSVSNKGFVESHSLDSYFWIFGLNSNDEDGYIDAKD